jgi:hypothetical protein
MESDSFRYWMPMLNPPIVRLNYSGSANRIGDQQFTSPHLYRISMEYVKTSSVLLRELLRLYAHM